MYRGRFAPSPTGRLHFGSLVAALGSWLFARAANGRWIVRMEDIDHEREVPGAAADILATLSAFGLQSDEPVVFQSARTELYKAARDRLAAAGHVYRCWCSRSDLEPYGGIHPAECVAHETTRPPAWRVRVYGEIRTFADAIQGTTTQHLARTAGDFVIWRADTGCAYQLAVVVDDAAQGVTDIVRGADLLDSTPRQMWLQHLLGLPHPRYAHLPLVLGADGRKLSKHTAALPVDAHDPLPALCTALRFLGQAPAACHTPHALLAHAVRAFDARAISHATSTPAPFVALRKDVC
ncbi:MAG: tRNA glutamyl-Q(34) synthetase GluQRS [Rhodanobacter sp.]|jgi:glutamyl-Q tRNA(Asp) synthetase|nr:tRNA glutamyl-Q(34) synthetase GluQRS [Rhodanobacter sp.]